MVANALAIARITSLFSAVMLFGSFSLLSAALFVILDAVDVALTEAAVGAGISTILMLATLARTKSFSRWRSTAPRPLALVLAAGVGLLMLYTTQDYPRFASAQAPAHRHVVPRYLEQGPKETGVPNVVTSVLASYRGYDTLGEVVVIFTAGIGVIALLGLSRSPRRSPPPTGARARPDQGRANKPSDGHRDTRIIG